MQCLCKEGGVSFPPLCEIISLQFSRGFRCQRIGLLLLGIFLANSRFFTIRVWGVFAKCPALSGAEDKATPTGMVAAVAI